MSYQQQPPNHQQQWQGYPPPPAAQPSRRRRNWPWILGMIVAAFVALAVIAAVTNPDTAGDTSTEPGVSGAADTPAKPAGPARTMDGGVYQVGVDVQAGRYKTPGPATDDQLDMCYWSRSRDDSGELDALIANGIVEGRGSVTVNRGEFVEVTGSCTWTKVG